MSLPHAAVGWSAVCDCGISWSYSLVFCPMIAQQDGHIMSVPTCGSYNYTFLLSDFFRFLFNMHFYLRMPKFENSFV